MGGWVSLHSRSGGGGEEKNSQPLPGLEPPIIQPTAQRNTAQLSRSWKSNIVQSNCNANMQKF